ncbi:MAG: hypothetical protein CM1200mP27_12060 [Chloroflexota bacterium]|nr:MAG: hypothetical protein CM1200mP27_12060 [Chloroflexota bacterium]
MLAMLVACQTETGVAKEIADKDPTFEISAVQIAAEYASSESAADRSTRAK